VLAGLRVVSGVVASVNGTSFDLRKATRLQSAILNVLDSNVTGFNHVYCLRGPAGKRLAARWVSFTRPYCLCLMCLSQNFYHGK
jgi:hypothetical protein